MPSNWPCGPWTSAWKTPGSTRAAWALTMAAGTPWIQGRRQSAAFPRKCCRIARPKFGLRARISRAVSSALHRDVHEVGRRSRPGPGGDRPLLEWWSDFDRTLMFAAADSDQYVSDLCNVIGRWLESLAAVRKRLLRFQRRSPGRDAVVLLHFARSFAALSDGPRIMPG